MYNFSAMDLYSEPRLNCSSHNVSSLMNILAAFPEGRLKRFFSSLQSLIVNNVDGFIKFMSIRPLVVDFTTLDAFVYGGKLGLSSSSISVSVSSPSTIVLVSTAVFSFPKTYSVIASWLILLIITCLNVQRAWWVFNPLRDLKRRSHKVHIWTMLRTRQTVRYKLSHEKCLLIHEYKFLVILVNMICVSNS